MTAERMDEQFARLERLSEGLFGEPNEVELAEAEDMLKTAGVDPLRFKGALYRRMRERSEKYSESGEPLPPLLQQALEDLEAARDTPGDETGIPRRARLAIARLFREIGELTVRLEGGLTPVFAATYRNRKELSARDKEILDEIADDLRNQVHD